MSRRVVRSKKRTLKKRRKTQVLRRKRRNTFKKNRRKRTKMKRGGRPRYGAESISSILRGVNSGELDPFLAALSLALNINSLLSSARIYVAKDGIYCEIDRIDDNVIKFKNDGRCKSLNKIRRNLDRIIFNNRVITMNITALFPYDFYRSPVPGKNFDNSYVFSYRNKNEARRAYQLVFGSE